MLFYVDASVALHALLPWGDGRARAWLQSFDDQRADICSSTLLQLEMIRVLRCEQSECAT